MDYSGTKKQYGPNLLKVIFFGLISFIFGGLLIFDYLNLAQIFEKNELIIVGPIVAIFVGFSIIQGWAYLNNRPRIEISPRGISHHSYFKTKTHRWAKVGVFASLYTSSKHGTTRYVCAYTDKNHDVLHDNLSTTKVTLSDADITFNISSLTVGNSASEAEKLVIEINSYRDKYGSPDDDTWHIQEEEKENIRAKKKRQRILTYALPVILFIAVFLFSFYWF